MKLIIGETVEHVTNTNVFKIHLEFMQGDGDGYPTQTIYVDKNDPNLISIIEFFERFLVFQAEDYSGAFDSGFHNFDKWDELFEGKDGYNLSHPRDDGGYAHFEDYTVTYFSESGTEYYVIIED